jgi:hypothetical protein
MKKIFVKHWGSYVVIQTTPTWNIDTITKAYEQAYKEFKQNPTLETTKEFERLYNIKKQMDEWT